MIVVLFFDPKPAAMIFKNRTALIDTAVNHYAMVYEKWDREKAFKRFGDQIPPDLDAALSEHESVIESNFGEAADNSCLYASDFAISRDYLAMQAILCGSRGAWFGSLDEARAFINGRGTFKTVNGMPNDDQNTIESREAVKRALIEAGYWDEGGDKQ